MQEIAAKAYADMFSQVQSHETWLNLNVFEHLATEEQVQLSIKCKGMGLVQMSFPPRSLVSNFGHSDVLLLRKASQKVNDIIKATFLVLNSPKC